MENTTEKSAHDRLIEAWENMPIGSKNKLCIDFGYTKQNIADILKNGRKDEAMLEQLLIEIKTVSSQITEGINDQNNRVQAI